MVVGYDTYHDARQHKAVGAFVASLNPSFTVVSKRLNTRFFTRQNQRPPGNPECWTVVDDVVTLRDRYDFFIVTQKATQGSVSPTSFNIIEDINSGITPDVQQRLANALTHVYYNWAVSFLPHVVQG